MLKRLTASIPNAITCCNLLSGCVAIYMAFHRNETFGALSGQEWAYIAIAAAAVFDFCDGASARLLRAYSEIGRELDSLSDLVSFGVAPAMLMLNTMLAYSAHPWLCFAALFIPAMGALRLAKFNIDVTQATTFKGLPIPANAIFWVGFCSWISRYGYPGTAATVLIIIGVSLLMVCKLRMFSLKFKDFDPRKNFTRYVIILATAAFVIAGGVSGLLWSILLYILLSVFSRNREA